jgi:hypothetical protein
VAIGVYIVVAVMVYIVVAVVVVYIVVAVVVVYIVVVVYLNMSTISNRPEILAEVFGAEVEVPAVGKF